MPEIAELRVIDGQTWVRVPVTGDEGSINLLSDAEIARLERDGLRAALTKIRDTLSHTSQGRGTETFAIACDALEQKASEG